MDKYVIAVGKFFYAVLGSAWFWIAFIVISLVALIRLYYVRAKLRALENLNYSRSFAEDGIFIGGELEYTEIMNNPGFWPLLGIKVEYYMPAGITVDGIECVKYTKITSVFHLPPKSTVKKTHSIIGNVRGHLKFENAMIRYRKNEFLFSVPQDIYIYPDHNAFNAELPIDLYRAGNSISERKYIEDPFLFSSIRPYRPGDPMKLVNFKASARVGEVMCNSFESSRNFNSMVILDMLEHGDGMTEEDNSKRLERGLSYACHLILKTVTQGGAVGYASNCATDGSGFVYVKCAHGKPHVKRILEQLASVNRFERRDYSVNSILMRCAETLDTNTDIYLITDFVDRSTRGIINNIKACGINVCIVNMNSTRR